MSKLNFGKPNNQNQNQKTQVQDPPKTEQKKQDPPKEQDITPKNPTMSDVSGLPQEIIDMRDFVASNIISVKEWPSNEGGIGGTLRLKALPPEKLPEGFENVADVADSLFEYLKDVKVQTGTAVFANFDDLKYNKKTVSARGIKANIADNTITAMLNVEYGVSGAKGSFQSMVAGSKVEEKVEEAPTKTTFSFSKK